ncbi:sigma 54-interacting transcriptional regulator [Proteinivorax tanatarense]|uniref:Sigma 54-interacting transcriptional regulator n=1 Tax=Proteinivorax tanatarense TaxID=1260629 RepID=A0AAU7VL96_9FIRM
MELNHLTKLTAKDAIIDDFTTATPLATIEELNEIMLLKKKEEVLVMEKKEVVGIVTKNDLIRALTKGIESKTPIKSIMASDVITFNYSKDLIQVRDKMRAYEIKRAPVINEADDVIGIITVKSICDAFSNRLWYVVDYLQSVLNNLKESVFIFSHQGEIYCNKQSVELFGDPPKLPSQISKEIEGMGSEGSFVYKSKGKEYSVYVNLFSLDGNEYNKIVTVRDVSDVSQLNDQLTKANSKLHYLEDKVKKISRENYSFGNMFSVSKTMEKVVARGKQVAPTNATVLVYGESGTGKELLANAIHQHSKRKNNPIITVNCGAIPENLAESEFFGYCNGAFTGAQKEGKPGIFELANGGTLFLDEIGELPINMQAKLLRALQEGKFYRVGGVKPTEVDVRVIAATNKNLAEMVQNKNFREDLFYRINVANIELPPLRERKEDIIPLAMSFLKYFNKAHDIYVKRIEPEIVDILENYNWPGNVRELKNIIERLVVFSVDGKTNKNALPNYILEEPPSREQLDNKVEKFERDAIINVLKKYSNNKAKAAKELKIPRSTLYYRMKVLNIK